MLLLVWWQVGNTSQNNMEVYCSEAVSSVGPWQGGIHCPSVPVSGPASYNHPLKKYCNYLCPVFHIGNKFSKKGKFLISHCVPVTNTKPKEVNLFIYLLFTYLAHLFLPNKNLYFGGLARKIELLYLITLVFLEFLPDVCCCSKCLCDLENFPSSPWKNIDVKNCYK